MNRIACAVLVALPLLTLPAAPVWVGAQDKPPAPPQQPAPSTSTPAAVVYKPPLRGVPGGRVAGGTRGTGRETFVLAVLAPEHTGLTTQEQPSLYWFISNPTVSPVELTILDPRTTQPLLETRIAPPIQAGVHRIRLADHGVRLAAGVPYRWFVSVVADGSRRAQDVLAGGTIERVDRPDALKVRIASASRQELAAMYAEAGVWYDAIAALSESIELEPQNRALREQRAALLSQVGLPEISE